ncbi:MAG: hypothetical protein AB7V16_10970 [Vulcanibacillus sp.]
MKTKKIDTEAYAKRKRQMQFFKKWAIAIGFVIFVIVAFAFVWVTSGEKNAKNGTETIGKNHYDNISEFAFVYVTS